MNKHLAEMNDGAMAFFTNYYMHNWVQITPKEIKEIKNIK